MSAEELSVTFSDVETAFSQPVLESRVEEIVQEGLNFREAFRTYDATGINSNVVEIPVPKDEMGSPKIVGEGSEFPRDQENYETKRLEFDKFGFEVALTFESQLNSQTDLVRDQVDKQARAMSEDMNERAFEHIDGSGLTAVGDANGTLAFGDVLAGREALVGRHYSPNLLVVNVEGAHDLLASNNFLEATDDQSSMRRSGQIGRIAGLDVVEDDSGLAFSNATGPQGLLVDTDFFGYEGERYPVTSEQYGEDRSQTEVYRLFNMMGWLVMEPDAGVVIDG